VAEAAVGRFRELLEGLGRPAKIYEPSITADGGCVFLLLREGLERKLVILCPEGVDGRREGFVAEETGEVGAGKTALKYLICACDHRNASVLRGVFPFTRPRVMGLTPAVGTGDRIGLATPGHIRAVRGFGLFPVLAQQSIREMARTSRSPEEVLDDVSWAVFQEGYRGGFAADADHLKSEGDIDATLRAGFTMYTIDPSDHVDGAADRYDLKTLREKFRALPWDGLECGAKDYFERYLGRKFEASAPGETRVLRLEFTEEKLLRAAVKYSAAIAHTARMGRRLESLFRGEEFDLEMSVDETETPTSALEHFFIASELRRLGVPVQGLALRFVGEFEKAVDYVGDVKRFEETLRDHVLIARALGPYKLSVHSGSDKFSVYPALGRLAGGLVHLKTAGTSYLEALRVVARHRPDLFREIISHCLGCFEGDRRTYRVSTELSAVPRPEGIRDEDLERTYLDGDRGRQLLHVTFGSILTAKRGDGTWLFRDRIREVLIENEEDHYRTVAAHLERHITALGLKRRWRSGG